MNTTNTTSPVDEYIRLAMPWLHKHQVKAIALIVEAILEHQTGVQAGLVRSMGNQEASLKQLSRLIHNERLDPRKLADGILDQALLHLPKTGRVRIALDWTIEDDQHLLVMSLLIKGRAVPVFWRAYQASVLKGRMKRYEAAIVAWSRFFALFSLALLVLTVLVVTVLLGHPEKAAQLLRLITSRRRSRLELSLVNTMLKLLKLDYSLFDSLSPHTIFPISFASA